MNRTDITAANILTYNHPQAVADYSREENLYPIEADLIRRYFPPPPARLLDIGCGAGRTTAELARMGYRVTAIDLADALLRAAREKVGGATFLKMDAAKLEFPDASFDGAIFSFNGMDCIYPRSHRCKVFTEVRRVLVPGGVFYYSGHNILGRFGREGARGFLREWRRHARFLARQRSNRALVEGYWLYWEPSGEQLLYSGSPASHLKELKEMSFRVAAVRGAKRYNDPHSVSLRGDFAGEPAGKAPARGAGPEDASGSPGDLTLRELTLGYHHIQYVVFTRGGRS